MADVLQENEVTVERLAGVFRAAFMTCTIDSDGDLKYEEEGVKTFVRVDTKRKLIVLFSMWPMKERFSVERKLQWINDLNKDLIVVKFQMVRPETLWCDYQLRYEGGLLTMQFISTVRLFSRVCRGAAANNDPDDIIGRD